ncbi:MAG: hypothetical protein JWO97_3964 [Acidobacteria bacterium]|nr:hypothetical protein [Acidobacteriota bacterium]
MKRVAMCAAVALLSLPLFAQFTTTTGDTTTQYKVGIGLGAPSGVPNPPNANLDIGAGASTTRFLLSGAEYFSSGSSNSGGLAFLLGVNRTGNRQLWIADSERTASSSSNTVLRLMVFTDSAAIDAVSTNTTSKKLLVLGNAGNVEIANFGKVGINTQGTAPLSLLHMKGAIADLRLDGSTSAELIQPNAAPMYFTIAGSSGDMIFRAGSSTEYMRVRSNGNVGIGASTPGALLHLSGVSRAISPYLLIERPSTSADGGLIFQTNGATTSQWTLGKSGSLANEDLAIGYGDFSVSNQRMLFTAGGNVGIGRATPLARLDVNGSIRGNSHLGFLPWTVVAPSGNTSGYVRLLTPIVSTEVNSFTLHIVGYRYATPQSIDIRCSGSALFTVGLQAAACSSIGTDLPIQLASETVGSTSYVVVRIGTPTTAWFYDMFSVEYEGEVPHDASGFTWSVASTAQVTNMNNVAIRNSGGGFVEIGQPTAPQSPDSTERLKVHGSVVVDGNIGAKYQDVAEWVPVASKLSPGTVVIVSPDRRNEVMASTHAYDTAIAGVVSAQPGLILGEGSDTKAKIATTGRVKVHVDATKRAIKAGDLLVTGDKPGTAMLSEPIDIAGVKLHRPGTLVGKALEPLESGEGDILVLLSLQ